MNRQELIEELKCSLPSRRMLEVVNFGLVEVGDELFVLKARPSYEFNLGECILYSENHGMDYPYKELIGKSVIFNDNLIRRRGKEAIKEYLRLQLKELKIKAQPLNTAIYKLECEIFGLEEDLK